MKRHLNALAASALPLAGLAPAAAAQAERGRDYYYDHMWSGGFGIMGFGFMLLFWGLIIFLVVIAVRWLMDRGDGGGGGGGKADPLETLRDRLARGEIDPAEYEERKKALEG